MWNSVARTPVQAAQRFYALPNAQLGAPCWILAALPRDCCARCAVCACAQCYACSSELVQGLLTPARACTCVGRFGAILTGIR
eukprot:g9786.t1